jgi:FdhE protein
LPHPAQSAIIAQVPATTFYQRRIRHAGQLASQHPFAAEVLGFYVHIARFQQALHDRLEKAPAPASVAETPRFAALGASFHQFLSIVEEHGPARVASAAHELRSANSKVISDLLSAVWNSAADAPSTPEEFLAFAFLQPYAESARSHAHLQLENYTHPLCPFCNRKPAIAALRPMGDGAQRKLLCGFCLAEWDFRRIVCPNCGEENHARLPVYTAETLPYIRVECCDSCRVYIKSIDLSKNGLADPLVDELASIPLDLWAQEHGYTKLRPNLLGM